MVNICIHSIYIHTMPEIILKNHIQWSPLPMVLLSEVSVPMVKNHYMNIPGIINVSNHVLF